MRSMTVFNFLLEATVIGSVIILLVIAVRALLRDRLGSRAIYAAWLLVALRLLLPLSLPNPVMDEFRSRWRRTSVPFPVSWTVKMKKKQKETQDILSYHTQAAGCSDKARAKASGGRQPIEECGRTGL